MITGMEGDQPEVHGDPKPQLKLADLDINDELWIPLPEELAGWQMMFDQAKPTPGRPQRILVGHDLYAIRHIGTMAFPEDDDD